MDIKLFKDEKENWKTKWNRSAHNFKFDAKSVAHINKSLAVLWILEGWTNGDNVKYIDSGYLRNIFENK